MHDTIKAISVKLFGIIAIAAVVGLGITGCGGTDGVTPHVGDNGNWWVGNEDTGVPADPSVDDPNHTHQWGKWIAIPSASGASEELEIRFCGFNLAHMEERYTPRGKSVPGDTLTEKLAWLETDAVSNTTYLLTVSADEELKSYDFDSYEYNGKNNVTINIVGIGSERILSLKATEGYSLFLIRGGVSLALYNNITLKGHDSAETLVQVMDGCKFLMRAGSKVTGNGHGGVVVGDGTFEMSGGTISGNTAGGVSVSSGTFQMSGGEISGNTVEWGGGGVSVVSGGIFEMSGGKISGNTASNYGGGVYMYEGTFEMSGGKITDNTASNHGGVSVSSGGIFEMSGGEISGNTASDGGGGGVGLWGGTFQMSDGKISGNTASSIGGGVLAGTGGTFEMSGGEITGNTASNGGGVGTFNTGTFTNNGGTISGNNPNNVYEEP